MFNPLACYRHVWCIDFEYQSLPGELSVVHCMVAKDLVTGRSLRLWQPTECPFACSDDELFVAHNAAAESLCFKVLGWPPMRRVFDTMAEFRVLTNGCRQREDTVPDEPTSI